MAPPETRSQAEADAAARSPLRAHSLSSLAGRKNGVGAEEDTQGPLPARPSAGNGPGGPRPRGVSQGSVAQPTLTLRPRGHGPPASSVHGVLQARRLEAAAVPFCRGSSRARGRNWVSCPAGRFLPV